MSGADRGDFEGDVVVCGSYFEKVLLKKNQVVD